MEFVLQVILALSALVLIYTYVGYPALVYLVSILFPKPIKKADILPSITVLITAYNEERDIREKLENTLAIDYPKDKFEILVASDGSTDRTDEIVEELSDRGVRLFRQEGRVGKTITQNNGVKQASGEIILFSDATTMYSKDVLRRLIPNFADGSVGCVAGKLVYVDKSDSGVGKGARSYWNYETFLKETESKACSLIGASGCLYAVRKSAYRDMYPEACSDFLICTILYEQGLRTVYEPDAVCTEETNRQSDKEMKMRVRVISQTFTDLWRNRRMMNPFRTGFYAIELISHKLLRYSVPVFLLTALVFSGILSLFSVFYLLLFLLQAGFYLIAFIGWVMEKTGRRIGLFVVPFYFVLANIASMVGFYKFLVGERYASWEPLR